MNKKFVSHITAYEVRQSPNSGKPYIWAKLFTGQFTCIGFKHRIILRQLMMNFGFAYEDQTFEEIMQKLILSRVPLTWEFTFIHDTSPPEDPRVISWTQIQLCKEQI